jgi:hypothetical protein
MFEGGSAQPPARKQKMHAPNNFKRTIWLGLLTTGMGISPSLGNTELSKTYDCTTIELEAVIDQNASREDNLERLSHQFFQSVNRIEHCDRELQTDSDLSSSSSAADASADDTADASNNAEANASADADDPAQLTAGPGGASTSPTTAQATPSNSLVGTSLTEDLPNMFAPSASNMAGTAPMADPADIGTATSNMTVTETDAESETAVAARPQMQQAEPDQRLTNGKIPDDIPNADNDSAFEVQIRAAAMAETDPDTQKNLWNEYRRYKGLPEQE